MMQDFPDGVFPAEGKSKIEAIFPPPYFEWYRVNEVRTSLLDLLLDRFLSEYVLYCVIEQDDFIVRSLTSVEECINKLCDYITRNGPFHGLLGFSQVNIL